MFQNRSLGPSTSSKTPKLTAPPPPPHGICFGSLINRGSLLFFFDWCLSPIGKEIMQTFSPNIPWGRFSNLLLAYQHLYTCTHFRANFYFYNVSHFLVQLVPSELYFVQWKHHISICYCFDFRCSCRTCHNKKTIQQDFVRIRTDSGVYRDSIIVSSSLKSYPNPNWISESLTTDIQEFIIYKFCKSM